MLLPALAAVLDEEPFNYVETSMISSLSAGWALIRLPCGRYVPLSSLNAPVPLPPF